MLPQDSILMSTTTHSAVKDHAVRRTNYLLIAAVVLGLGASWIVQYIFVLPAVFTWEVVKTVAKTAGVVGVVALVLLFIPFLGWLILAILLLVHYNSQAAQRRNEELIRSIAIANGTYVPEPVVAPRPTFAEKYPRIISPWGWTWAKATPEQRRDMSLPLIPMIGGYAFILYQIIVNFS